MEFPSELVKNAVEQLSTLPGIGKRSALRLTLHLLKKNKDQVEKFGNSFIDLINNINYCKECFTISDFDICKVCSNPQRDKSLICVVEDIRTMMAIENTLQYKGVYHVLGGLISPLEGIAPDDLRIEELISKTDNTKVNEIIFALSTTMEGDTTNYYLYKRLKGREIKISSIARGIAIGDELEYTDEVTLGAAISSRLPYSDKIKTD
ncbi:recombination mediator RecR [bacterium]|jgi:recombination protein RecR|nr:recombination mediator RecR [bacterium]|tara:strand:+ start:510 stop:1130 length:621 start_codon:yes stop_codon:yes gene_type:complete